MKKPEVGEYCNMRMATWDGKNWIGDDGKPLNEVAFRSLLNSVNKVIDKFKGDA